MDLVDPSDSLEQQNRKLRLITEALMRKVQQSPDQTSLAYSQFERAALLEEQVRQRTRDLERTLDLLHESNSRFALARQEAEDARANLADAIETIDEGFAMFDQNDRLVLFNSRFCQALGSVRRQLDTGLGFGAYIDLVSRSDALSWQDGDTPEAWRTTRANLHRKDHVVFNIRLKGNRWMQVSEHRTDTGGTVILQTDVSEIMRLERRARDKLINQQALMLRATLNHLKQGVAIFDSDRRLVDWNRGLDGLLLQRIGTSFRGADFGELLHRLDRLFRFVTKVGKAELQDWARQPPGRDSLGFEVRRDDSAIFDVFAQELPDGGFVISFTDITQERRSSDALRELNETLERRVSERTIELGRALEDARRANASKTRFVAAASHDLLQPMSAAKLYASLLEDRLEDSASTDLVRKTTSALESAETIIAALLDISKLELGLAAFEFKPVSLERLFRRLEDEFAPAALEKGLELRFVWTSQKVSSDASYLYRVLQNIISNAIRYTTGRKILVGVRGRGETCRIEVLDQGPGISDEDQAVIFQEFRRLDKDATREEGLGLGLAIVERACKMLGHDLSLSSVVGRGSRFSVTLPCEAPRAGAQISDTGPGTDAATHGRLVGLVENDAALSHGISLIIEALGSDVLPSSTAEDALTLYEELGVVPDCFLLDYQLGEGMLGTDLVSEIRARHGDVPITVISADRSALLRTTCADLGVGLRHKPLTRAEIADVLMQVTPGLSTSPG